MQPGEQSKTDEGDAAAEADLARSERNSAWTETVELRLHELESEVTRLKASSQANELLGLAAGSETSMEASANHKPKPDSELRWVSRSTHDMPVIADMQNDISMERQPSDRSSEASFASHDFPPYDALATRTPLSAQSGIFAIVTAARQAMPAFVQQTALAQPEAFSQRVVEELWK